MEVNVASLTRKLREMVIQHPTCKAGRLEKTSKGGWSKRSQKNNYHDYHVQQAVATWLFYSFLL